MRLSRAQREDGADPRLEAVLDAPDKPEALMRCKACHEALPCAWWACAEIHPECPMGDVR